MGSGLLSNFEMKEIIFYKTDDGAVKVEILLQNENLWLTQKRISELFDVQVPAISKHLQNIYLEGELEERSTISKMEIVQNEGSRKVKRLIDFYNLDAIIAVGYRVNSKKATQFRIWATDILKEYIVKGFAMDDQRLKTPNYAFGKDYFEEQLERIRDIRSSERRFYQKITDIYAQCSADYDVNSDITKEFFSTVQNKLHFAIVHKTAAEIIYNRADSKKDNMGLTTWKSGPKGNIRKKDVSIAKNYLNTKEMESLNRIVSAYLDFAEIQASKGKIMYMSDWVKKLDAFLQLSEYELLNDKGKVSSMLAKEFAECEFEKYNKNQVMNYQSDFDKLLEESEVILKDKDL